MELTAPAQASDQVLDLASDLALDLALDQDLAQDQAWDQALALLGMVRAAVVPTQAQVLLGLHTHTCFVSGCCMSCV